MPKSSTSKPTPCPSTILGEGSRPLVLEGARVLELGAGTGLVGLVAHALGSVVALTDQSFALPLLAKCVQANYPDAYNEIVHTYQTRGHTQGNEQGEKSGRHDHQEGAQQMQGSYRQEIKEQGRCLSNEVIPPLWQSQEGIGVHALQWGCLCSCMGRGNDGNESNDDEEKTKCNHEHGQGESIDHVTNEAKQGISGIPTVDDGVSLSCQEGEKSGTNNEVNKNKKNNKNNQTNQPDILIASDCIHWPELFEPLVQTLHALCRPIKTKILHKQYITPPSSSSVSSSSRSPADTPETPEGYKANDSSIAHDSNSHSDDDFDVADQPTCLILGYETRKTERETAFFTLLSQPIRCCLLCHKPIVPSTTPTPFSSSSSTPTCFTSSSSNASSSTSSASAMYKFVIKRVDDEALHPDYHVPEIHVYTAYRVLIA